MCNVTCRKDAKIAKMTLDGFCCFDRSSLGCCGHGVKSIKDYQGQFVWFSAVPCQTLLIVRERLLEGAEADRGWGLGREFGYISVYSLLTKSDSNWRLSASDPK